MNPDEIITDFQRAVELFGQFRMKRQLRKDSTIDLIVEAQIRLEQTLYLLRLFRQYEREQHEKNEALGKVRESTLHAVLAKEVHELGDAIKLYGEAFYYFASRTLAAMGEIGLKFKAPGIVNARNNLIEHPTKTGGTLVDYWVYDCSEGLILRGHRVAMGGSKSRDLNRKPIEDPGLYPNAKEFVEALIAKIETAMSK